MSWDAYFSIRADGQLVEHRDWNYTHNTNSMISAVLTEDEIAATPNPWWDSLAGRDGVRSWYVLLDGMSGQEGAAFIGRIVDSLCANPDRFRAMNPENGWGSYDTLWPVLHEMQQVSARFPTGEWRCSG